MLVIRIDGGGGEGGSDNKNFISLIQKEEKGVGGVTLGNSRGEEGPHADPSRWEKEGGREGWPCCSNCNHPPHLKTADADLEEHLPKSGVVAKRERCQKPDNW